MGRIELAVISQVDGGAVALTLRDSLSLILSFDGEWMEGKDAWSTMAGRRADDFTPSPLRSPSSSGEVV